MDRTLVPIPSHPKPGVHPRALPDGLHPRFAPPPNLGAPAFGEAVPGILARFRPAASPGVIGERMARKCALLRVAADETDVLTPGAIRPVLTARRADEAAPCAARMLRTCLWALEGCPPVDGAFANCPRAPVTADRNHDCPAGHQLAILAPEGRRGSNAAVSTTHH